VHPLVADATAASGVGRRAAPSVVPIRAVPVNEPYLGVHLAPIVTVQSTGVCLLWVHRVARVRRAIAVHDPERTLEVHYEALRADSAGQLRRIAECSGWRE